MRFLLICYVNPSAFGQMSQSEIGAHLGSYLAFNTEAQSAGVLRGAEQTEQLPPFAVTVSDGQRVVTDGPLEQTAHMVGGLYIIDVKDRAEAEAWAARVPAARDGVGSIQVHQLADVPTA
jgi:hypothetical protein